MQRGLRSSMFAGTCACAAVLAFAATDCADATQIIVDVRSDACPAPNRTVAINSTGIAVGSSTTIDNARDAATKQGCESGTDRVGTLTIYPSGDNDAEVTFRVVSGVEVPLDECKARGYAGCITQHRTLRFEPRTTRTVTVRMSLSCLGKVCPAGQTCEDGVCVSSVVLPPGQDAGQPPIDGGPTIDAADATPPIDGTVPIDAPAESGTNGCNPTLCNGAGRQCMGNACVVNCSMTNCNGLNACPANQDCRILCNANGNCNGVQCTTTGSCEIACVSQSCGGSPRCDAVASCKVTCNGANACNTFALAGGPASIDCASSGACGNIDCKSQTCDLKCAGGASACTGSTRCCRPPGSCQGPWVDKNVACP